MYVTDREFHTVLAALERYADHLQDVKTDCFLEASIASNGGEVEPLSLDELTDLIERINTTKSPEVWVTIEDGLVAAVTSSDRTDVRVITLQVDTDASPRCPEHSHTPCGSASEWTFTAHTGDQERPGSYTFLGHWCSHCKTFWQDLEEVL